MSLLFQSAPLRRQLSVSPHHCRQRACLAAVSAGSTAAAAAAPAAAKVVPAQPLTKDALLCVFKSIDLDDSGTIELSELEAFFGPCLLGYGASIDQQSRITELFAQGDTDGSGEISFDEFCEARPHLATLSHTCVGPPSHSCRGSPNTIRMHYHSSCPLPCVRWQSATVAAA